MLFRIDGELAAEVETTGAMVKPDSFIAGVTLYLLDDGAPRLESHQV